MKEYQTQLEKLVNITKGLDDSFFKSCFISNLKDDIQVEVKMFNPKEMIDVIALDNLVEDKFNAQIC